MEKINCAQNEKSKLELKAELNILRKNGFSFGEQRLLELKKECISTNMTWFFDQCVVPEMIRWRQENPHDRKEKEATSLKVLLESVSKDYIYGYVDREMPPISEKEKDEENMLKGKMSQREYYDQHVRSQEQFANQLEGVVQKIQQEVDQTTYPVEAEEEVLIA